MNPLFFICQQRKIIFQRNNVVITCGGNGFLWKTSVGLSKVKISKNWLLHQLFQWVNDLQGGNMVAVGIYAFLPMEMVTRFPVIIQEDVLLVLSIESIIFNNKWNKGIFYCVLLAFCSTFYTLISGNAPLSSKTWLFRGIPFDTPCYPQLM